MTGIIDDDFGVWFKVSNTAVAVSVVFLLILVSPLPHTLKKVLTSPATLRVKLGDTVTLQISHIILVVTIGVILMLIQNAKAYDIPSPAETVTSKNYRLSKKWQYETYLWQCYITVAWWLYIMKCVSLNDYEASLEEELGNVKKVKKEEEKDAGAGQTKRPKGTADKKND